MRVAGLAALAALVLHGIVLSGLPGSPGVGNDLSEPTAAVRVRTIPTPAAALSTSLPMATAPAAPVAERTRAVQPMPASPAPEPPPLSATRAPIAEVAAESPAAPEAAASAAPPDKAQPVEPVVVVHAAVAAPSATASAAPAAVAPAAPAHADTGEEIPVYPTALAPPQTLVYHLKRGLLSGTATLDWRHDAPHAAGAGYELQLDAKIGVLNLLSQRSEGSFDAAGLAPTRFTDQRLRGSTRAANFQRERGVIGFSGPAVEYPLVPGVQDRLSWMLQLPAIVAATPARAAAGERITLYVIGARGDVAVWVFRFAAAEAVATDTGEVPALKFIREPRKPNDTQAEVWLDPARHHLPVRARIGNPPDGEVLELLRSSP